jgi:hypothetical protein
MMAVVVDEGVGDRGSILGVETDSCVRRVTRNNGCIAYMGEEQ